MFGCSLSLGVSTEWKRPPLSCAFVKTEHILEPKRSHLYPHLGCNLEESAEKAVGRHVCGISLPPTHNSPSGTGQGVRRQPERSGARETCPRSPFPSSQTILWMCVQMPPKCQSPSLALNSLKPPHYLVSLRNSEYSRYSCKPSTLGSNLDRLMRRLKQGQEGRSLFLNPMLLTPNFCEFLWKFAPGGLGGPHRQKWSWSLSSVCSQWRQNAYTTGPGLSWPSAPTGFQNYLVNRIFNVLFQNCLQQSGGREDEKQRT